MEIEDYIKVGGAILTPIGLLLAWVWRMAWRIDTRDREFNTVKKRVIRLKAVTHRHRREINELKAARERRASDTFERTFGVVEQDRGPYPSHQDHNPRGS